MKKYFALILTFILIFTCFTACKPTIKDGAVVTNAAGENFAAVTEADGGIKRDGAGNLVVLVTDEDGRNVKENGENITKAVAIQHALVIGDTIEMPEYSIQIPNGWSDSMSFENLVLSKDGTADKLTISVIDDKSFTDVAAERSSLINSTKTTFSNTITDSKGIEIGEIKDALFYSAYVPDAGNGAAVYLAFILFEHAGDVYSCMINSNTDISASIPEITEIISTINFVH
ncbi:MAG: hypothetical protein IJD78_00085 [Clostridia bacterium]|nr:hypothetical protein [Clostridia bacterium]MBQ3005938.1 hypothetical protein [Clostridia bacterium]